MLYSKDAAKDMCKMASTKATSHVQHTIPKMDITCEPDSIKHLFCTQTKFGIFLKSLGGSVGGGHGCNQIVAIPIPAHLPEQTEPDVLVQQTAVLSLWGWGHHMAIEEH